MQSSQIRSKFLQFFKDKGHSIVPSASLIPENDPSVLFTTAGMQPLVPYLKGEKHPLGKRLTNVQKCIRTVDIDNVGDSSHLTFFEMLGYWSLGDYFKKESIHFTFDFYTQVLGFNKDDISVTVFEGNENAPFDLESYNTWKDEIGIPEERIYKYGSEECWWGLPSGLGPCGPNTEMFIDTGKPACSNDCGPACSCGKFIEIGNNVFLEFLGKKGGVIEKLAQKNVDVGLGLERLTMFNQNVQDVYMTDLFLPIIGKIEELSTHKYDLSASLEVKKSFRIIADHLRAATFMIGDENGIVPGNTLQGYVLRRLIRRAVQYGRQIGAIEGLSERVAEVVIDKYGDIYPELKSNRDKIISELNKEEMKFGKTIENGLKEFERITGNEGSTFVESSTKVEPSFISGSDAFLLFQSYGFPIEMTQELAAERGIEVDMKGFEEESKRHQDLSRTASAGMFKGGLADNSEETTKLHTAAHLLLASLRQVLGEDHGQIMQKGSNITAERLRFDFNYPEKLTPEQIAKVEELVNDKIKHKIDVELMELSIDEAKGIGATAVYDFSKYGDRVKVYKIGDFSLELCGGPHVKNTGELGQFKIIKEESSSGGVRRIKATLS